MIFTIIFLLILIGIISVYRRMNNVYYSYDDDYEETVTTTTTTTTTETPNPEYKVATVGVIYAFQKPNNPQWFVIDPVDKEETPVDDADDYYRDAGGKVWDLQ